MYLLEHQGFQEKYPSFQTNFLSRQAISIYSAAGRFQQATPDKFSQVGWLIEENLYQFG